MYTPNLGRRPTYAPRSREEMAQIEALVRSAIGFDAVRGDMVEVINMRFATPDAEFADGSGHLPRHGQGGPVPHRGDGGARHVAILVILLVIRPLMARAFERDGRQRRRRGGRAAADRPVLGSGATHMGPGALAQDLALEDAQAGEELEQMIDINRVEGRVRASSLRKVGEIVDKHPEEAVSIIRSWLYQET